MVNGVLFLEDGGVQPIGTVTRLAALIENIELVLPQLKQQEAQRKLQEIQDVSFEVLERELQRRQVLREQRAREQHTQAHREE